MVPPQTREHVKGGQRARARENWWEILHLSGGVDGRAEDAVGGEHSDHPAERPQRAHCVVLAVDVGDVVQRARGQEQLGLVC